ncbi:MAG: hypothetical protein H6695_16015 [Deferribacteres bacterium]|nr:hypothetical protein [candidate division KSB1 bacterium]MCB9511694.1 hypothetical protein [Deferribacteres bacterium]
MKKMYCALPTAFILILATAVFGQRGLQWRGSGGWGPGEQYGKMYDVNTVETISGEVLAVETFTARKGIADGVHLTLKTEQKNVTVHLGPAWFVEQQDTKITPKDQIEVTGSKISYEGRPVLVAAQIIKNDETLTLRSETGYPAWAGWRAANRRGPRGMGKGMARAGRNEYDPATVKTITGTVLEVEKHSAQKGNFMGFHLKFKTDDGEYNVYLGPEWFMNSQKLKFAANDQLEVTGSFVSKDGQQAIIAREIKKGTEVLNLRNEIGKPVWSGGCCKS